MLGLKLNHVSERGHWKRVGAYSLIVATNALVLKHQTTRTHNADQKLNVSDQFHKETSQL